MASSPSLAQGRVKWETPGATVGTYLDAGSHIGIETQALVRLRRLVPRCVSPPPFPLNAPGDPYKTTPRFLSALIRLSVPPTPVEMPLANFPPAAVGVSFWLVQESILQSFV